MARFGLFSFIGSSAVLAFVVLQAQANSVDNAAFLSSRPQVVTDLLHELERVVGRDQRLATERRVGRLEVALRPMFLAMPKDSEGKLHATSVRYLLHRLFVQRHGWFVNGLEAAGESWNSSLPTAMFEQHVDDEVHDIFHEKLSENGFSLHQVAVFAATLEVLVHEESIERLQNAYRLLDLLNGTTVTESQAVKAVEAYMMMYVLNLNHTTLVKDEFTEARDNLLEIYPTWPDTQLFVREVRESVLLDIQGQERDSWSSTLHVLEEVGERYGRWQDKECRVLKDQLVTMDEDGDGRVPLDKFYSKAVANSSWQFLESVPYLRQLGALDENDPERLSVIIPNYINSPSNCVASSKFYAVCCIDECEALLGSLETHIGAPEADPALIVQLVGGIKSSTVSAPRQLDAPLLRRLDEIAAHHGGNVQLHGRLFAQWMHHAYPRECPYPHVAGTTKPMTAEEYFSSTGVDVEATHEEIYAIMNQTAQLKTEVKKQELPWTLEEELFVHRHDVPLQTRLSGAFGMLLRGAMLAAALGYAASKLMVGVAKPGAKGKSEHKYYV